jgi:hypothetical protein
MIVILLLLFALLGAVVGGIVFCLLWRSEHAAWKQERFWRLAADWRYAALKDAIETECRDKVLATLRLRMRWIENPPPFPPVVQQQNKRKVVP